MPENQAQQQIAKVLEKADSWLSTRLPKHIWWITMFLFFCGVFLIFKGVSLSENKSPWGHVIIVLGSVLCLDLLFAIVHHYFLKAKEEEMLKYLIGEEFKIRDKEMITMFENSVKTIVSTSVASLNNSKHIGLTNIHEKFDPKKFFDGVGKCPLPTVILQRTYFSPNELSHLSEMLKHLIDSPCNAIFKILLLAPDEKDVIRRKTAPLVPINLDSVINIQLLQMKQDLEVLYEIYKNLPDEKKGHLQIKIYRSYNPLVISGFGERIFYGFHPTHHGANSIQMVATGKGTELYGRVNDLFNEQFSNASDYPDGLKKPALGPKKQPIDPKKPSPNVARIRTNRKKR